MLVLAVAGCMPGGSDGMVLRKAPIVGGLDTAEPTTWKRVDANGGLAPLMLAKPPAARTAFFRVKAPDCRP